MTNKKTAKEILANKIPNYKDCLTPFKVMLAPTFKDNISEKILEAMEEYAAQAVSPKWIRAEKGNLPKKIKGTIFRQISSKIILSENMAKDWIEEQNFHDLEWLDETPTNVSPQAAENVIPVSALEDKGFITWLLKEAEVVPQDATDNFFYDNCWNTFNEMYKRYCALSPVPVKEEEKVSRDDNSLYTYYQIDLENISEQWDYTICESLEEIYDTLKYLDIHLDDDTELPDGEKRKVIVTGIGMSPAAYRNWVEEEYPEKLTIKKEYAPTPTEEQDSHEGMHPDIDDCIASAKNAIKEEDKVKIFCEQNAITPDNLIDVYKEYLSNALHRVQDKEVKEVDYKERAKGIYKRYAPDIEKHQKTPKNMFLLGCEAGLLQSLPIKK